MDYERLYKEALRELEYWRKVSYLDPYHTQLFNTSKYHKPSVLDDTNTLEEKITELENKKKLLTEEVHKLANTYLQYVRIQWQEHDLVPNPTDHWS